MMLSQGSVIINSKYCEVRGFYLMMSLLPISFVLVAVFIGYLALRVSLFRFEKKLDREPWSICIHAEDGCLLGCCAV
jgi:hypothetical protein